MSTVELQRDSVAPRAAIARPQIAWLQLNIVSLLAAAVWLRAIHLENIPGINGDEAWSGVEAARFVAGEPIAWRTPSGNPINPFFLLPLAALNAAFGPSFLLLRLVPLASGLAALAANYFLCRRRFDRRTATISTLLLALLPINIAYSRFAWDASQSLLATVLVMYLALGHGQKKPSAGGLSIAATLVFVVAVLIHPTNLFAAPLLVVPPLIERRRQLTQVLRETKIPAKSWAIAALGLFSAAAVYALWKLSPLVASRLHGPEEMAAFAKHYLWLFSGTTAFEYLSGLQAGDPAAGWYGYLPVLCDLALVCVAIVGLCGVICRLTERPTCEDASLVLAWGTMLVGFFLVAGPGAIAPHFERYGICLIAPAVLLISRGLAWWLEEERAHARAVTTALALTAWLWLASFFLGYYTFIEQTGGRSHLAFRSAATEPKQAALAAILAERKENEPLSIVCHDWWTYWPLEYLAHGRQGVSVMNWEDWQRGESAANPNTAGTWFVEFADTEAERQTLSNLHSAGIRYDRRTIYDYAGRPLLTLIHPLENSGEKY